MSISVNTTAGNSVQVTVNGKSTAEVITQTSTVTVTPSSTNAVTVTSKGPKGDTGETGATGPTGPAGADGAGVIAAGTENQFLQKNSATDYDTKWSAYTLPAADGNDGQVLTTDGAGAVSFAYPKTISENVKNVSGGPLLKGTPVHVTGSVGNLAEVIAADAATNYPAHFVLDEDLADEGEGLGIALGFINNVDVPDASIYTEGQTVYLASAGGWSTTKPTGTNAIQNLGIIIKVNTSGNKISGIIMGAGRSNDVPNIPNGQTWIGNASGVATPTTLATVATTGSYNDLSDQPTIPTDTNLGNADQTLSGTRVVDQQGENFEIDVNGGQFDLNDLTHNYISASSDELTIQGSLWPSTDGSSGQMLQTNGSGTLSWATPTLAYGSISCGFFDDISNLVHYLPLNAPPTEVGSDNNSYTDWLCPCDIRVLSVEMRFSSLTAAGDLTVTVEKDAIGSAVDIDVESETVSISGTGDIQDVIHFKFDNATLSAGEKLKIKIQASVDITGSSNTFVNVVYLADWSTRFTQASTIITP